MLLTPDSSLPVPNARTFSKYVSILDNQTLHSSRPFVFGKPEGCRLECSSVPNSSLLGIKQGQHGQLLRSSLEGDPGKILALVRFYPQLEPEHALRHELQEPFKISAIKFTFSLEEATVFIPCRDGSLLKDRSWQPYLQWVLPYSACSFPQSTDRGGCSSR